MRKHPLLFGFGLLLVVFLAVHLGERVAKTVAESSVLKAASDAKSKTSPGQIRLFQDLKAGQVIWLRRETFLDTGVEFQSWLFVRDPEPIAILFVYQPTGLVLSDFWSSREETYVGQVMLENEDLVGLDLYLSAHGENADVVPGERERLGVLISGVAEPLYFDAPLGLQQSLDGGGEKSLLSPNYRKGMIPFSWLEEAIRDDAGDFRAFLQVKKMYAISLPPLPTPPPQVEPLVLYEGLPHPTWESDLFRSERDSKPNFRLSEQTFYQGELKVSKGMLDAIRTVLGRDGALRQTPPGVLKMCGGFHADFALVLEKGTKNQFCYLICFGCHEVLVGHEGAWHRTDLSEDAYVTLKKLTETLHNQRPASREVVRRVKNRLPSIPVPAFLQLRFPYSDIKPRPLVPEVSFDPGRLLFDLPATTAPKGIEGP